MRETVLPPPSEPEEDVTLARFAATMGRAMRSLRHRPFHVENELGDERPSYIPTTETIRAAE